MDGIGERARGIGYRPEIAAELLGARGSLDFLEVVAEGCVANGRVRREVQAFAEVWPIVPHGVKLSLGSAEGIDPRRLAHLAELARLVRAPVVTEHVALTSAGGREIGHLTPIPRTREAVRVVARNAARARAKLPDLPLLLENIAAPFGFASDAMSEPDFYAAIADATGCALLLDVANLYANAINAKLDPVTVARAFPLERVGMIHIAGGVFEDGFYFDTHAHAVPAAVLDVLAAVLERAPGVPIVLERDAGFEVGVPALVGEIDRAHARRPPESATRREPTARAPAESGSDDVSSLAGGQAELARALTSDEPPSDAIVAVVGAEGIERARNILKRKRVDDALPLLASLSARGGVRVLAEHVVARSARGASKQAVADAAAIAEAASSEPRLADDAARDHLALRARFFLDGDAPRPRRGPFVARAKLRSGHVLWAVKSFGEGADVRIYERAPARGDANG